jgi:hypothetical protein
MTRSRPSSILPKTLQEESQIPRSSDVPVMSEKMERFLFRLILLLGGYFVVITLGVFALLAIAFKPVPDMVIDQKGLGARMRPLDRVEQSEPEMVVKFLEERLPRLYTWTGVIRNDKDPTGLTFIRDPGKEISIVDSESGGQTENRHTASERIPTTVFNEQFILSESIRVNTLREIAKAIGRTGNVIFQTDPNSPWAGVSYRFVFRGRPQYPVEVSPGRWKVVVNADIVRISPGMSSPQTQSAIKDFNFIIYVRRAGRNPHILPDLGSADGRDLVAYGKSSGFEIDWMTPYSVEEENIPNVN